ncbi:hypothetical protein KYK30_09810 [Shinella yambaruensis]|uniref:Uncharacterized protein n=1 Tax=Shinella yambaruensis TaxID=415996 RepID=A0ABQ5ZQW0_9HYPH|nr:hypothetical protein [Shinella yambaruensis]MCJ8027919.1 hypothetical protein [Shinella yambaruensis]MCU7979989.1 hypothetical protein [Shinella yambaruensis]GLR55259.1 hypothetical protein GCM10007923_64820 [Shinella yambaruensis]
MDYLLVIDNATGEGRIMTLAEAAALTLIEAADIERSILVFGVCQSMDFVIVDTEAAENIDALAA